jgi:hypothetical protein
LVEQRIENPRVGGSNPPPGTTYASSDAGQAAGGPSTGRSAAGWLSEVMRQAHHGSLRGGVRRRGAMSEGPRGRSPEVERLAPWRRTARNSKRPASAPRRRAARVAFVDALGAKGFVDPAPGKAAPETLRGISHITGNIALQHCFSPNGRKRDEGSIAPLLCNAQNESWTIMPPPIMPPSHLTM